MRLSRSPAAIRDVDELWLYIARHDMAAADKLVRAIDAAAQRLVVFPFAGRERSTLFAGLRSVTVRPYVIFYPVAGSAIVIVRVLHGARDIVPSDLTSPA